MDFYRSILINDRVRENCRVGGVRASIHVKNFPFIRLTQRVPVIEITCEANCDNLTLVRPSFVHGSASIFFPPISLLFFPERSITIIPRSRSKNEERERELEISSKSAAKRGEFIPPRVARLVKRGRSRKGAVNRPSRSIHEIRLDLGIGNRASRPQVGHCPPGDVPNRPYCGARRCLSIDPLSSLSLSLATGGPSSPTLKRERRPCFSKIGQQVQESRDGQIISDRRRGGYNGRAKTRNFPFMAYLFIIPTNFASHYSFFYSAFNGSLSARQMKLPIIGTNHDRTNIAVTFVKISLYKIPTKILQISKSEKANDRVIQFELGYYNRY